MLSGALQQEALRAVDYLAHAMTAGLVAFVIASIGATIALLLRYGRTP